ncbi:hypothetical protein IFT48_01890 [Pseudomonas fluorescens]|uniref:hypothetical protein n=1 Tax=Pseudomonas fluorescens TaxID=294 RepID=UPI001930A704|nr:hypothetical protein [Pseudomonas fluorescens]MBD8088713.1 hypothetical protein [Pseudomonas fluorescens]
MKTLKIPFCASQVNMSPNAHVFGTVSMMGLACFGHAALRLMSTSIGHNLLDLGTALVVCEHNYFTGYQKPAWSKTAVMERAVGGAAIQEYRVGTIKGYVILRLNGTDEAIIALQRKLAQICFDLAKLRFIGGRFFPDSHAIEFCENDPLGLKALENLPYDARVYVDNTPLIARYAAAHNLDHLNALITLTRLHEKKPTTGTPASMSIGDSQSPSEVDREWIAQGDEAVIEAEIAQLEQEVEDDFDFSLLEAEEWADASEADIMASEGWIEQYYGRLIAVDVGYRLLEDPLARPHRFSDQPHYLHAYAEPVLGLARLQIVASCRKHAAPIFWQSQHIHPYLVSSGKPL